MDEWIILNLKYYRSNLEKDYFLMLYLDAFEK